MPKYKNYSSKEYAVCYQLLVASDENKLMLIWNHFGLLVEKLNQF
jgi:hypothetical protein